VVESFASVALAFANVGFATIVDFEAIVDRVDAHFSYNSYM
jgi:hypothetical protein